MKNLPVIVLAAFMGAVLAIGGAKWLGFGETVVLSPQQSDIPVKTVKYSADAPAAALDFTYAAEKTLPAVVHIQSAVRVSRNEQGFNRQQLPEFFRDFFGDPRGGQGPDRQRMPQDQMRRGSGSGVIIGSDGFIVTNNHVIADAEELTVTLNDQRTYTAKVIGTDPSTDIALIKIEENGLPVVRFSDSDAIKVGEWVVAVGNPFNLESTVTAGIVSAKGRAINIMQDKTPIESFIQTDAAINPGNSGGALVNLRGEMVGVNTAIASPTGSYTGYGFAVPSNIVSKIVSDLKEYGVVQRGFIGAVIRGIDGNLAKEKGLTTTKGVYVESLTDNSAAAEAGIKAGDIITAVDGISTPTSPKLLEMIGRHRPGDRVPLTIVRDGREKQVTVTLKNSSGNTEVVKKEKRDEAFSALGAGFETISREEARRMGISGGVRITELERGILRDQTDVREGFVITSIDGQPVGEVKDIARILKSKKGGVMMEGKYPNSNQTFYYAFGV